MLAGISRIRELWVTCAVWTGDRVTGVYTCKTLNDIVKYEQLIIYSVSLRVCVKHKRTTQNEYIN